jgi:hypothetical protein
VFRILLQVSISAWLALQLAGCKTIEKAQGELKSGDVEKNSFWIIVN